MIPEPVAFLAVVVAGQPVGKGRPQFFRRGNNVGTKTPDKTVSWERGAEIRMRELWGSRTALDEPLTVVVDAVCRRPQHLIPKFGPRVRKVQPSSDRLPCMSKPDLDNIAKIVLDALVLANVMKDDTRVVELRCSKQYAAIGEQEHVEVVVLPWVKR